MVEPLLTVDRYELLTELASGGMATVYLGRVRGAVGFARIVAIKRLHRQFASDPDFRKMFIDEARVASRIRHPNVVPTLDVVSSEGELFLVMEYVHGESLAAIRRATSDAGIAIPIPIASAIVSAMLLGLHAAHEAKDEAGNALDVVHRDVSPQNVIVGADGIARVVDFGIAKAVGRLQSTTEGQLKGKAGYIAPEQVRGRADRRSDIYASAVVLWELLTGQRLFSGESHAEVIAKVLAGAIRPPHELEPRVGEALEEVVMSGLDSVPERRFATAREMERALRRAAPPATAFETADWLETALQEQLKTRRTLVASVETPAPESRRVRLAPLPPPEVGAVTEVPTVVPEQPVRRRSFASLALVVSGVALTLGSYGLWRAERSKPTITLAPSATPAPWVDLGAASSTAVGERAPEPAPTASTKESASAAPPPSGAAGAAGAASLSALSPSSSSSQPTSGAINRKRPLGTFTRPSCIPPYTIDAQGHQKYKDWCL